MYRPSANHHNFSCHFYRYVSQVSDNSNRCRFFFFVTAAVLVLVHEHDFQLLFLLTAFWFSWPIHQSRQVLRRFYRLIRQQMVWVLFMPNKDHDSSFQTSCWFSRKLPIYASSMASQRLSRFPRASNKASREDRLSMQMLMNKSSCDKIKMTTYHTFGSVCLWHSPKDAGH